MSERTKSVADWSKDDVKSWLFSVCGVRVEIDFSGKTLLLVRREEFINDERASFLDYHGKLQILDGIRQLQLQNLDIIENMGYDPSYIISGLRRCEHEHRHNLNPAPPLNHAAPSDKRLQDGISEKSQPETSNTTEPRSESGTAEKYASKKQTTMENKAEESNATKLEDGTATRLRPELGKTLISLVYCIAVALLTAFVMVIVHDRVPDMKKYPPLPDIFLDNVPHIPWAFAMCECTATMLLLIWIAVLVFHKHRFILLRRFFAISGTVFLLRCVTMLITSLSVPGTHLQCNPIAEEFQASSDIWRKLQQAYTIWSGAGMSILGVRTCGDYMFSGHTSALTILNFFITEYTPRHLYFMHTFSWMLNMFGIFFILSAHEHYSIDVFIAFYITSRLFLYYHTLANNQALMQRDSTRTRIWFPLFSFFESEIDGIIPNEYETLSSLSKQLAKSLRDALTYCYTISMRRDIGCKKND